jgi:hypothetical protein
MTTEQPTQKPWAGFGYEPVGAITMKLIGRYLRTQRKNMKRFFEERGMFALADRMNQIRNSRQGMMAKNRMFQGVLNEYAALTAQKVSPRAPGTESLGAVQGMRTAPVQGVAESTSGVRAFPLDGVAEKEPGANAGDPVQSAGLSNTDPIISEDL